MLLSTLDRRDQRWAEEAVAWGVEALEEGWQKGRGGDRPLQAALVSLDPHDGSILAYVGGRDYRASQFDRAGQARRQAGSAFKPVVYAAAFEDGVATPSTLIEDAPLTVRLANQRWSPQNDDGDFHGWVTARTAIEHSYNVAAARLALQTGLPRVVELARGLGVTAPLAAGAGARARRLRGQPGRTGDRLRHLRRRRRAAEPVTRSRRSSTPTARSWPARRCPRPSACSRRRRRIS